MIHRAVFVGVWLALLAGGLRGQGGAGEGAPTGEPERVEPGEARNHRLEPGGAMTFRYVPRVDGEASVWARSEALDVALEVRDQAGEGLGLDDDSGGWRSAHVVCSVSRGKALTLVVRAKEERRDEVEGSGEPASFQLAVVESEVTEASLALLKELEDGAAQMRESRKAGAREEARAAGRRLVERIGGRDPSGMDGRLLAAVSAVGLECFYAQDIAAARACWALASAGRERMLPPEHSNLARSRANHAAVLRILGDLAGARALEEEVLRVYDLTLAENDPILAQTRQNCATTLKAMGDLVGAKDLEERVLRVYEKTLPADHLQLASIRMNHASTLRLLGDLAAAKALQEQVLRVYEKALPAEHPNLAMIRGNYASTLTQLGDVAAARALEEQVLRVYEKILPPDHPDLAAIRNNYALTLMTLRDFAGARAVLERVLEVHEATLRPENPSLAASRQAYASTLKSMGDLAGASALEARVLRDLERTLPAEHPHLASIRHAYASTLEFQGDLARSKALHEEVLKVREATLPADDPALGRIRRSYVGTLFRLWSLERDSVARTEELREHVAKLLEGTVVAATRSAPNLSSRQASLLASRWTPVIDLGISCLPDAVPDAETSRTLLRISEEIRGKAMLQKRLPALAAQASGELEAALEASRLELFGSQRSLANFIADPTSSEGSGPNSSISAHLAGLVRAAEDAEARHRELLMRVPGVEAFLRPVATEDIAGSLPEGSVGVGFWGFTRRTLANPRNPRSEFRFRSGLAAFVLSRAGVVTFVDLGAGDEIRSSIEEWRRLIGHSLDRGVEIEAGDHDARVLEAGRALRERLIDPVLAAAGKDVGRLVVALSDDLHLVPLDALPLADGGVVGDRIEIDVVNGLQWLVRRLPGELNPPRLLAMGDVDYLGEPRRLSDQESAAYAVNRGAEDALGQPVWRRNFEELTFTEEEVRSIAKSFERAFDDEDSSVEYFEPTVLRGRRADKTRLRALAPSARYLHVATHGWFAPDSIPSITDRRPEDEALGIAGSDFRDEVRGYEPLALCGLALAGAGLEPNADGSHPGLVTGTEIAQMDLSGVELAVLSACETNVGDARAGQGIASLQEALFTAGVRYSITSLWKVPDEATKKLMTSFYQGIWRRGMTKREALWNAKMQLRNEKDPRTGEAIYGPRDWAGWVLFGNPE